jgi:hypothetical protein
MARIINIIKDPHFCSWEDGTEDKKYLESCLHQYRAFVEDDEGQIRNCHLMNNMDFEDDLNVDLLLKEEESTPLMEEDTYSLTENKLLELIKGQCMEDCSPSISVIESLLDEMEAGGIDLKIVLVRLLRDLYEQMKT